MCLYVLMSQYLEHEVFFIKFILPIDLCDPYPLTTYVVSGIAA